MHQRPSDRGPPQDVRLTADDGEVGGLRSGDDFFVRLDEWSGKKKPTPCNRGRLGSATVQISLVPAVLATDLDQTRAHERDDVAILASELIYTAPNGVGVQRVVEVQRDQKASEIATERLRHTEVQLVEPVLVVTVSCNGVKQRARASCQRTACATRVVGCERPLLRLISVPGRFW